MIALVLAMVRTRRGQAVTLGLLAMFAVAAAVSAPAYLSAADEAVSAGQLATAGPEERAFLVRGIEDGRSGPSDGTTASFADIAGALIDLPGFAYVYAAEYPTLGIEPDPRFRSRFTYRQDVCAHLEMVSGRCLIGAGEVVVGTQTARRLRLVAGQRITLTFAQLSTDPGNAVYRPEGVPKPLTVAGVYRVPDPQAAYWGAHGYFAGDPGDRPGEPVFATAATLAAMDHGRTVVSVDGVAGRAALRVDNLENLRAGLTRLRDDAGILGQGIGVESGIPALLDRIQSGRAATREIVPVVAVPLVLLACLTIFLTVGYGTEGRRPELAVVALRGTHRWTRWWLATGESLVAITVGAVAGCLVGQLLVNAMTAWWFPGGDRAAGLDSLRYAPIAAGAAVLAALLAQRRQMFTPVADLLRRSSVLGGAARELAAEGVVVLLAVVAGAQLLLSGGDLTGLGRFAPALIALALAALAARALLPLVTRYAARALRRGRPDVALAAFPVARRAGAGRLFALLVGAVAVIGYAACAVDVAAQGRAVQATVGTGADRVLSVEPVGRAELLTAVRAADPEGTYAMAVVSLPGGPGEPPGLAVDSVRLARVANWPAGAPAARTTAQALRGSVPPSVILPGRDLSLDVTSSGIPENKQLWISAALSSVTGQGDATVELGTLDNGTKQYRQRVPACRDGCRLKGIRLSAVDGTTGLTGRLTITGIGTINPVAAALPAEALRDPARWRVPDGLRLAADPRGLRVDVDAPGGLPDGGWVRPTDAPVPLPLVAAGGFAGATVTGFDGGPVPVTRVAGLPAVPRAGTDAVLVDLEYADRLAVKLGQTAEPQVWLSADAPADIRDRLAARGLVVARDVRADQVRRQLDQQGPALALGFFVLAGALAAALAAGALIMVAAVDRGRRVTDLTALRVQGLSRRAVARATLWTYPVLAAAAVLAGLPITALLWWITGWTLPLAGLDPPPLPFPGWPRVPVMAGVALLVFLALAAVAYAAGRRIRREVR
ncbi:FtsX-like permease family protein [Jidongwangia harbinensis]|uniref:FtsX-like permease family protein n=1 Tax=Jidongwangia harbinensis TaxID=2878561 RepID=UPI001CD9DA4C|nr:FtsX-like permease family protein [Jidongwangia harbinensis]MCA2216652.1 hypothetical protein [Jidongwangia harbinensis]